MAQRIRHKIFAHGSHLHVFCMVCMCRFHNSCPLNVILENIDKISIVKYIEINNKIKELEAEKIDELGLLEEELMLKKKTDFLED